jgi:hypothetical protein
MVRGLEGEDLDGWLKDAEESRSAAMQSFAASLRKDSTRCGRDLRRSGATAP